MEIKRRVQKVSGARQFHRLKFKVKDSTRWIPAPHIVNTAPNSHPIPTPTRLPQGSLYNSKQVFKRDESACFIRLADTAARAQFLKHTFIDRLLHASVVRVCKLQPVRPQQVPFSWEVKGAGVWTKRGQA